MTIALDRNRRGGAVDIDLERRATMLSADGRDDLIVAAGLCAAERLDATGLEPGELLELRTPYAIAAAGDKGLGDEVTTSIRLFYDLWYRLKVPFGCASLRWWYLLALSLRDIERSPEEALALTSDWIETLEAVSPDEAGATFAEVTGLPRGAKAVVTAAELSDVDALARAVTTRAPLLAYPDGGDEPDGGRSSLRSLCHGRRPLPSRVSSRVRDAWQEMAPEDRTMLLTEFEQRFLNLEQVRLSTGSEILDNAGFVARMHECLERAPSTWSAQELTLASLAWCWREAGFVAQELNQSLIFLPTLAVFMARRIGDYDAVLGRHCDEPETLIDAARLLGARRAEVEKSHLRCLFFDGSNWERREFLVERASLSTHEQLPTGLEEELERRFGVPFGGDGSSLERWDDYLERVLELGFTPTDLIRLVADWAANARDLPVDYAIFTAPQGVKLERPWELELTEVFCYTAFRSGLDPAQSGVPFDPVGIQNAIGQRMRYNVVKKAQNYAQVRRFPAQSFNLPDIAIGEDANHGGHRAGGIRLSCRVPTTIGWRGRTWKGIADVRLNRLDYSSAPPFEPSDLPVAFRYVKWEKGIADATYRRGLLFDSLYCSKLEKPAKSSTTAERDGGGDRVGDAQQVR